MSPEISAHTLKYSRFRDTHFGDWFDSHCVADRTTTVAVNSGAVGQLNRRQGCPTPDGERHRDMRMTIRLTREQRYELVWSEALVRLGKGLGISDVAIAKQCRKAGIPIPERGYWNKLQAGHAVARTPLTPRDLATVDVIEMNGELKPEHRERFSGEPGIESAPEDIDVLAARFRRCRVISCKGIPLSSNCFNAMRSYGRRWR